MDWNGSSIYFSLLNKVGGGIYTCEVRKRFASAGLQDALGQERQTKGGTAPSTLSWLLKRMSQARSIWYPDGKVGVLTGNINDLQQLYLISSRGMMEFVRVKELKKTSTYRKLKSHTNSLPSGEIFKSWRPAFLNRLKPDWPKAFVLACRSLLLNKYKQDKMRSAEVSKAQIDWSWWDKNYPLHHHCPFPRTGKIQVFICTRSHNDCGSTGKRCQKPKLIVLVTFKILL